MVILGTGVLTYVLFQGSQSRSNAIAVSQSSSLLPSSLSGNNLLKAPSFTLPTTSGKNISLSDYLGKKNVLLYFMEGVMCDPCFQQLKDIQTQYGKFRSLNIDVLTITVDPVNALVKDSTRFGITLPILDDGSDNLAVSKAYGMLDNSMHPGSRPGHSFVLISTDGNIVWKNHYYPAGANIMGMNMDMNGRMYVPVNEILQEIHNVAYRLPQTANATSTHVRANASNSTVAVAAWESKQQNTTLRGTSTMAMNKMCSTPIHYHADIKFYINGTQLNLAQRKYMDQAPDVHFHTTVKVKPNDIPGIPFADMVHIHAQNLTINHLLKTLDLNQTVLKALDNQQMTKVYVNGVLNQAGLDYAMHDKERILVSYYAGKGGSVNNPEPQGELGKEMKSVTYYATLGKNANPSFFGGC